jgi:hypothetical protein
MSPQQTPAERAAARKTKRGDRLLYETRFGETTEALRRATAQKRFKLLPRGSAVGRGR